MPSKNVIAVAKPLAVTSPLPLLVFFMTLSKSESYSEILCLKLDLTLNLGFTPKESRVVVDQAREPPLVS